MTDEHNGINVNKVDVADFVGRELKLRTEQFPGKLLDSKVVGVSGQSLLIDRSGGAGLVNELINNQKVVVYIEYKDEPVKLESRIIIPHRGRMQIPIDDNLVPEINREFRRVPLQIDTRLACFTSNYMSSTRLNKLKWISTTTNNISGGGILVQVPSELSEDFYMVINIEMDGIDLPRLILGRVRHCTHSSENNKFMAGVQFITRENYGKLVPRELIRNLPGALFDLKNDDRHKLAVHIEEVNASNII